MPLSLGISLPDVQVTGGSLNATAAQTTPTTLTTPTTTSPTVVTDTVTKLAWAMQMAETIYVNQRQSTVTGAWVSYTVAYVFADGNAVLIREPDCVTYTGPLKVADNLRRTGEIYADS